ncbi:acetylxylan esterase [Micromonospora arborensis]|uniref:Acetylxylan esterase n=1 Tax=Micromonospora arborensis TaxID=2116518 RepID=A0A318NVE2_9ACTN|nr:acetylxylan esterase [Micromonospora arborensis]PYC70765.1 acetylxylan esterase [Micromonospora arborensis]
MPNSPFSLDALEQYSPTIDEPDDFDQFWRDTLAEAVARPVLVDVRPEPTDLRLLDSWDVTFAGFGGDPVRAWYTRPAGVAEPLPTVVEYPGYGRGRGLPHERLTWPVAGYAHLLMDNRGQAGQYGAGDTADPHGAPGGPSPVTWGILDPRDYHYRRLITDAVRAVEAVRALPGVDGDRVTLVGNSQGGGIALAVAGLVDDLSAVLTTAPFLCDMRRAVQVSDPAPYGEIARYLAVHRDAEDAVWRTLSYVDGVSFARRATAPAHFGIGLRDTVCPPRTGFAAYNQYGAAARLPVPPAREMHVYPFNGHEGGEAVHVRRQLRWLDSVLHPAHASTN